ncbi:MAG: acylphosphatase [Candidatus Omnitrophota bacterium]
MEKEKKRIHVHYDGRVQGVGFRFTAEHLARGLNLTGWVRNLPDGRVELVGEGQEVDLSQALAKIDQTFGRYIRQKDVQWQSYRGEFSHFEIRS